MPEILVTATIVEENATQFAIVVFTSPVDPSIEARTEVEMGDAATWAEAHLTMGKLIGRIVDRAERRGDKVMRVRRIVPKQGVREDTKT